MRGGIDSAGHAANDGETRPGEICREPLRGGDSIGRGTPGSHNRDGMRRHQLCSADCEQQQGRVKNFAQTLRDIGHPGSR